MLTIGILVAVGVLVGLAGAACQEYLASAQAAKEASRSVNQSFPNQTTMLHRLDT